MGRKRNKTVKNINPLPTPNNTSQNKPSTSTTLITTESYQYKSSSPNILSKVAIEENDFNYYVAVACKILLIISVLIVSYISYVEPNLNKNNNPSLKYITTLAVILFV